MFCSVPLAEAAETIVFATSVAAVGNYSSLNVCVGLRVQTVEACIVLFQP